MPAEPRQINNHQYLSGILCALCAFSFGSSIGWTANGRQEVLEKNAYSFTPTLKQWSWITALLIVGAATVSIPIAVVVSHYGCRFVMLILLVPYISGWVLHIVANALFMLYLGRFLLGVAGGMVAVAVPVYIIEIADIHRRGKMGCLYQICLTLGNITSYIVGSIFKVKIVNILNLLLSVIFCLLAYSYMHESPSYYIKRNNSQSANESLRWFGSIGSSMEKSEEMIPPRKIQRRKSISKLWSRHQLRSMLVLAIFLQILQQLCGGLVISIYWNTIFEFTSAIPKSLDIILMPFPQIICSVACLCVVDRIGRLPILFISAFCMSAASFILAIYFRIKCKNCSSWIVLAALCLFIGGYSFGLGPIIYLIIAEIFPSNVRPFACAIVATFNWVVSAIVVFWYLSSIRHYGPAKVFLFTTAMGIITTFFVYIFFPETKKSYVSDIQKQFSQKLATRYSSESG